MATVKFVIKGNAENTQLNIRVSLTRGIDFQRKTGVFIPLIYWNKNKKRFYNSDDKNSLVRNAEFKSLSSLSHKLLNHIESRLFQDLNSGKDITAEWLEDEIDLFFGRETKTQIKERSKIQENELKNLNQNYLINYVENYIDTRKIDDKIVKSTLEKFINLKGKLEGFSSYSGN